MAKHKYKLVSVASRWKTGLKLQSDNKTHSEHWAQRKKEEQINRKKDKTQEHKNKQ